MKSHLPAGPSFVSISLLRQLMGRNGWLTAGEYDRHIVRGTAAYFRDEYGLPPLQAIDAARLYLRGDKVAVEVARCIETRWRYHDK